MATPTARTARDPNAPSVVRVLESVMPPEPPPFFDEDEAPGATEAAVRRPAEPAAPATSAPPLTADEQALSDRWNTLVRGLIDGAAVSGLVRELAWQSALMAIEPGDPPIWRLRVEHEALRSAGLRDKLTQALVQVEGSLLQLLLDTGVPSQTPAQREAAERERRQREAERAINEDPLVRELLSQFAGARIVPGSIKPL